MKTLIVVLLFAAAAAAAEPLQPAASRLGPGVWAIFEIHVPSREPDGNSVIFEAPAGLVVVDTGRHPWHRDALLQLAKDQGRPIAALINSHWHLDHVSGNPFLREAYPHLVVYASNALEGARRGFLADSLRDSAQYLADDTLPPETREDLALDRLTILNGAALGPDVTVRSSKSVNIGGKVFRLNLARHAATAGDVWVLDSASGVVALGDLVTLPAPYLETACPEGWTNALASVAATHFTTAIPGHGPQLSAADLRRYRWAFDGFVRCAKSNAAAEQCAAGWVDGVQPLLTRGGYESGLARNTALYYVGFLRTSNFQQRYCGLD